MQMYELFALLLFLAVGRSVCSHTFAPGLEQCSAQRTPNLKFTVVSQRNQTGQWSAQVFTEHSAADNDTGPWVLNVDHSTAKCGGTEFVQISTTLTAPTGGQAVPKIRPDYELIPGHGYYKLHKSPQTFLSALHICAAEGAHLLILNSEAEAKALIPLLAKHPKNLAGWRNNWSFLGIHDCFANGNYVTIYSQTLGEAGYDKWLNGQIHVTPNECCGVINSSALLGDAPCEEKLVFTCEQEF